MYGAAPGGGGAMSVSPVTPVVINDPAVVASVTEVFERYEAALVANDVAVLDALFWRSPNTVRYGISENLVGYQAIAAFRAARSGLGLARTLENTVITTFGDAMATVMTEFRRTGSDRMGRQSQTWVRFPDVGWQVVAAHVSLL